MSSLEFYQLPLEEVSCKAGFTSTVNFDLSTYVNIWQSLSNKYPRIRDIGQIDMTNNLGIINISNGTQGVTLESDDVQIDMQPNMVVAKWTNRIGRPYARYASLREALNDCLTAIEKLNIQPGIEVMYVNMAYLHTVVPPFNTDLREHVSRLIQPGFLPSAVSAQSLHDYNVGWRIENIMDHRVIIQNTAIGMVRYEKGQVKTVHEQAMRLITVTGKQLVDGATACATLDEVHNAEQDLFLEMITDYAKEQWGYASGN
ncbi:MAG: TIGR04255 family protein [Chthonomonadales bacterium]